MRYAYAVIITMLLLGGLAGTEAFAQGRGNGRTGQESVENGRNESDDDRVSSSRGSGEVRRGRGSGRTTSESRGRTSDSRRDDGSIWDILGGDRDRDDDDWDDDDYDDRRRKGNGPPFCENGQGHPVHGREWCRDKGYGMGGYDPIWRDRRSNDDIIFRLPRQQDSRRSITGSILDSILGRSVYRNVDGHRRAINLSGPLSGYWLDYGRILQVRSGDVPVAEYRDLDRDGRVDVIRFNNRRY